MPDCNSVRPKPGADQWQRRSALIRPVLQKRAVRDISALGAQAGRARHFCPYAPVQKRVDWVRAGANLRRESSIMVQDGEPTEIDISILYYRRPQINTRTSVSHRPPWHRFGAFCAASSPNITAASAHLLS